METIMSSLFGSKKAALLFCVFAILMFAAAPAWAQEFRASISGHVLDPSGAGVPKAHVVVTNTATGVETPTDADDHGAYEVLYLDPGHYTISVTAPGFKKLERSEFELHVYDRVTMDLTMEMGAVSQTVNVNASQPLLDTQDADNGTDLPTRLFRDFPFQDQNPITLARQSPGVIQTGAFGQFARPFDSINSASFKVEGEQGQNEFTVNGLPNTSLELTVAWTPPSDAVQEVRVENDSYNAQTNGSAGTIDIAIKSGTNQFHGTAYEFDRNTAFDANPWFNNEAHIPRSVSATLYNHFGGTIGGPVEIPHVYNGHDKTFFFFSLEEFRFKVLDNFGANFTVPTCQERGFADTSNPSVCGAALGYLNLNDMVTSKSVPIVLYDPFTGATCTGSHAPVAGCTAAGQVGRMPLVCHGDPLPVGAAGSPCVAGTPMEIDLDRVSPIAQAYLKFFPLPNLPGAGTTGTPNLVPDPTDKGPYNNELARVDHVISSKQKLFVTYLRGYWNEDRGGWTVPVNGVSPDGQNFFRTNDGAQFGDTYVFSAHTILDFRVGFERFEENALPRSQGMFNPASIGFTAGTATQLNFPAYQYVPTLNLNGYLADSFGSDTGSYFGGSLGKTEGPAPTTFNTFTVQPTLTLIKGNHTMQFGWDFRDIRYNSYGPGDVIGHYQFEGEFGTDNSSDIGSNSAFAGAGYEQFMLGIPSGLDFSGASIGGAASGISYVDRNVAGTSNQTILSDWFFQDNIHVTPKLNVNVGVRYQLDWPFTERFNRNVRGFDFTDPNPFYGNAAAVLSNYATAYAAGKYQVSGQNVGLPPNEFALPGGLCFAGSPATNGPACGTSRDWWNSDKGDLAPRVGVAYHLTPNTVVRGGYGLYVIPYLEAGGNSYTDGRNQAGFSLSTPVNITSNSGLTFNGPGGANTCTGLPSANGDCWAAPFQGFTIPNPPNASLGLSTLDASGLGTVVPVTRKHPLEQHWSVDVQRELPDNWVIDVGYFANHGSRLITTRTLDTIPRVFLTTSNTNDNGTKATINLLNTLVSNPFQNECNATFTPGLTQCTGATIPLNQLLTPYSQWSSFNVEQYNGSSDYESGQVNVTKRYSHGLTVIAGYAWSKWLEQLSYLNATDQNLEKRADANNTANLVTISSIWDLPFGHGRAFGGEWPRALDEVLGGWQVNAVFRKQSGFPISIGNIYCCSSGTLNNIKTHITSAEVANGTPVFSTTPFFVGGTNNSSSFVSLSDNIRTLPDQVTWFRGEGLNNWDASLVKTVSITERVQFQLRGEAFNMFNHPFFSNPSMTSSSGGFGKITAVTNYPRYLELGGKLIF
jgi:trimeric autotransporter adhesin